jgi:hypothetical protein
MESSILLDIITQNKKLIFNAGVEAALEYANRDNTFTPQVQLLFSPYGLPYVPVEFIGTAASRVISNLSWSKDRNNPGGLLTVEITPDEKTIKNIVHLINTVSGNLYSLIWGELGVDLEDLFKPMTLCYLWINGYHIAVGTVRSCTRNASVDNLSYNVSYTVTIEELGNIYNMNVLSLDKIVADGMQTKIQDEIKGAFQLIGEIKGIKLGDFVNNVVNAFKITNLFEGVSLSDGFSLAYRLLNLENPLGAISNTSFARQMVVDSSLYHLHSSGGQQSIWSFLKSFIPDPWMEFYTESGGRTIITDTLGPPAVLFPGFSYIVARSVPYSNPLLGTVNPVHFPRVLPYDLDSVHMITGGDFIIITDDMIHEKSLGFDCINQSTIFHTRYACKAVGGAAMDATDRGVAALGPINPVASGGIKTFGIREMFQSIDPVTSYDKGTASTAAERIKKNIIGDESIMSKSTLNNLLAVWFRNQCRFREGTVVTRGIPYARPGMYCLYLPALSGKKVENLRDIGLYYIDSLVHNYSLENESVSFTTTLNLIRGVPMPTSVAQTALLLFDFDILPPESGIFDGEYKILKALRESAKVKA